MSREAAWFVVKPGDSIEQKREGGDQGVGEETAYLDTRERREGKAIGKERCPMRRTREVKVCSKWLANLLQICPYINTLQRYVT